MATTPLKASQAAVWVQPDGLDTVPQYLGCHTVGDVAIPASDITRTWCPDRGRMGEFVVSGSFKGEPGVPTTSIETPLTAVADYLEALARKGCEFPLYVNKGDCGRRDLFTNFSRQQVFLGARVTNRGMTGLAVRGPADDAESMQTFDISFLEMLDVFKLSSTAQSSAADDNLLGIAFADNARCVGDCGIAIDTCDYGIIFGKADASPATSGEVYYTTNGGTWTLCTTLPFAVAEDVSAGAIFPVGRATIRILVARGTTDAAAPAEVAYSDDYGVTWSAVNVGATPATNGAFVTEADGLFVLDANHIWLVTNTGYIYFSSDGGLSWTVQESGVITSDVLRCIKFYNELIGYAGGDNGQEVLVTKDGGDSWAAVSLATLMAGTDDITALATSSTYTAFIGTSIGEVYVTHDGGDTWTQKAMAFTTGIVKSIWFVNENVGWLLHQTTGPVARVFRTTDGGYTWELTTLPTNVGAEALWPCDENVAFVAGPVTGGIGFIAKVQPEA